MLKTVPQTPWLFPEEHREVVLSMHELGLIKFSNARDLPLKSGGKTDVYINLRDARNSPEALSFIADLFAVPLFRLHPDRFVEIPDSVSCFAGLIAVKTGIPFITIREQSKEGRVSDAKKIGKAREDEVVVHFDDVITDGASKVIPYQFCQQLGLKNRALVVLVDRQQGWKKKFDELGIKMPVWPGMTLHQVRKQLIESGLMQKCDPINEKNNPIVVALDGKSWDEVLPLIDELRTTGCILKVNDLLFAKGTDNLLPDLSVYGRVMADLKCHDISNTVGNTVARLRACPPWAVTVHASAGETALKNSVKALAGTPTKVLAITVLTSIDQLTCEEIYKRIPLEEVRVLAAIANRAGVHGFVCSPEEVGELKKLYPEKEFVIPGIRSVGKNAGDQKRIATPEDALAAGASNIVMGRQILGAPDPVAEVNRLLKEELGINIK